MSTGLRHKSVTTNLYSTSIDDTGIKMAGQLSNATSHNSSARDIDFHGAAIVNEDGVEIPITAAMVDDVLMQLRELVDSADSDI
ncbi:hypothetical protein G8770_04455 [Aestuariicella hydrocarbonica]|uniref:Uncharacterized protein n=1 Tax=Pseudomaricurvus hydrocarbonicus TaxID=1470433 RepID=A0A9E5JT19_9GAMM|nr:PA1571 family protein [Aestuariicella hydrocarbonica]NHO64789.1 hypothetical protein [Aestuariicella hydrocarbonica]